VTKIKLVFGYDGSNFHGFARQEGLRTVQGTLENVLSRVLHVPMEVVGSGRTDAGVHARAQVIHWTQDSGPPAEHYPYLLRRSLPRDILPTEATEVSDDFHARYDTVCKTYRYTLQLAPKEDIFTHRYAWHVRKPLDFEAIQMACQCLLGEHDFTSFCAGATPATNRVRTIHQLSMVQRESFMDIYCTGSGFLQHMVRIIVGTLVDVGTGKFSPNRVEWMLKQRDRRAAGLTAPAHGLCLWDVVYSSSEPTLDCLRDL
jgi:tRNA pseudouridine38-40 synthase